MLFTAYGKEFIATTGGIDEFITPAECKQLEQIAQRAKRRKLNSMNEDGFLKRLWQRGF